MKNSYIQLWTVISSYWKVYGGTRALVRSPYLHVSMAISILCVDGWRNSEWWLLPINTLPNLIGFTLGGYAILLAFGDQRFIELLRGESPDNTSSPYMDINGAFLHFLVLQFSAFLYALIYSTSNIQSVIISHPPTDENRSYLALLYLIEFLNFTGFLLFIYSILAGLAAAFAIFEVAQAYDSVQFDKKNENSAPTSELTKTNRDTTDPT